MGCSESKIKRINLSPESSYVPPVALETLSRSVEKNDGNHHPHRLLAAFALPDLGESLDSTHLNLNSSLNLSKSRVPSPHFSNGGDDSADSGYDEYEEDYSHIITENSSEELVSGVISDFKSVDLPELLVITGRACVRKLSGYQKDKINEAKILDTLRQEGLLAKSKAKTSGGFSFEVVDQAIKADNFVSSDFIPSKTLERLEERRENVKKQNTTLEDRLATAESRRKAVEEEKVEKCREICGLERSARTRRESASQKEKRFSASIAKRQIHLQEIRDRLKKKHKKLEFKRLKNQFKNDSPSASFQSTGNEFFDD